MVGNGLFYCPSCRVTYYLSQGADYLCPRHLGFRMREPWPIPHLIDAKLASPSALEIGFKECTNAQAHHDFGVRHYDKAEFTTRYRESVLLCIEP